MVDAGGVNEARLTGSVGDIRSNSKSFDTIALGARDKNLPVSDQIALGDAVIRRNIAYAIMGVFVVINILTLYFVNLLFRTDQADLGARLIAAPDRVVNAHVLMTLLGATTVQLGTITVIMARFIFRPAVDRGDG